MKKKPRQKVANRQTGGEDTTAFVANPVMD